MINGTCSERNSKYQQGNTKHPFAAAARESRMNPDPSRHCRPQRTQDVQFHVLKNAFRGQ